MGHIFKADLPICLTGAVFNQSILPVSTYSPEILTVTKKVVQKIKIAPSSMEKSMNELTFRDRLSTIELQEILDNMGINRVI